MYSQTIRYKNIVLYTIIISRTHIRERIYITRIVTRFIRFVLVQYIIINISIIGTNFIIVVVVIILLLLLLFVRVPTNGIRKLRFIDAGDCVRNLNFIRFRFR